MKLPKDETEYSDFYETANNLNIDDRDRVWTQLYLSGQNIVSSSAQPLKKHKYEKFWIYTIPSGFFVKNWCFDLLSLYIYIH